MELFDTHCHLDTFQPHSNAVGLLQRAKATGVKSFIIPGVTEAGWSQLTSFCRKEKGVFAAPGLHPLYLAYHKPEHLEKLEALCKTEEVVAIGEIGLDYFDTSIDRDAQQRLFEDQLHIAHKAQLPMVLHVRKAHDQVLATLRRKCFPHGGVVHAFSGSFQQAKQYIKLGFAIGIGGTITYTRAKRVRMLATNLDLNNMVLETDAPDIPVASHNGETNLPEYLIEILQTLADLRGEAPEFTAAATTTTAKNIFGLPGRMS